MLLWKSVDHLRIGLLTMLTVFKEEENSLTSITGEDGFYCLILAHEIHHRYDSVFFKFKKEKNYIL
jgi:hypothetical protein